MRLMFILSALLMSVLPEDLYSQISLSSKFYNYYDDNIYNNSLKTSDFVNSLYLGSAYDIESSANNLQFYYTANFTYYQKNIFKSSNSQKFGIVNTYLLAEDDNPLNAGVNYSFRKNRDEFSIFDFNQISAYANYSHTLWEGSFLLAGYLFNRNSYESFSSFSHYEHKMFAKLQLGFETKTTFMFGAEGDIKNYIEKQTEPSSSNNTSQMKFYLHAAQSIAEYTGLSGYLLYRKSLNTGTRYISSDEFIYYEEELFNDVYSNDGYETGITFTHLFSDYVSAKFEILYQINDYLSLPAATIEGYEFEELRKDKQYAFGAELRASLNEFIGGLNAAVTWNYIRNNSNDEFYNYDNNIIAFSLGLDL